MSVDHTTVPLSVESWSKLYSQNFWDSQGQKYGYHALKLAGDAPRPSFIVRKYGRTKDYQRHFGVKLGTWLVEALTAFDVYGMATVGRYFRELISVRLESVWVRKRWHLECRLWPRRMDKLNTLLNNRKLRDEKVFQWFELIHRPEQEKQAWLMTHNNHALQNNAPDLTVDPSNLDRYLCDRMDSAFFSLVASFQDLHRHFFAEIYTAQKLVVDYLKQPPENRARLHKRYGQRYYELIEGNFEPIIDELLVDLNDLENRLTEAGLMSPSMAADVQGVLVTLHADIGSLAEVKQYLHADYVHRTDDGWRGKFSTIPSGRYVNQAKAFEKLFVREMTYMSDKRRELVEAILDVLQDADIPATQDHLPGKGLLEGMDEALKAGHDGRILAGGNSGWSNTQAAGITPTNLASASNLQNIAQAALDVPPWTAGKSDSFVCSSLKILLISTSSVPFIFCFYLFEVRH